MRSLSLLLIGLLCTGAFAKIKKVSDKDIVPYAKPLENVTAKDQLCLAYSIYREAGNLKPSAQYAVGQVHINRLNEGSWGKSLCKVVFAKAQFSWTLDKRIIGWTKKQEFHFMTIAEGLIWGLRVKGLNNVRVLHYHANYVNPKWGKKNKVVAMAGPHIFYKDIAH
jgi:spore germination cell wall hydrolase CwlJ-like protein